LIVRRRTLLQLFAGMAVSGLPHVAAQTRTPRVVVAGAGIIGANIAYQLARRGAAVTVLDREGGATGATANSFAWINATFSKQPRAYYELNRLGLQAWRRLEEDMKLPVRWGGSLEWYSGEAQAAELRKAVRGHQSWGYSVAMVEESRLRALEPNVTFGPVAAAAHADEEGHVDPVAATHVLLQHAQSHGAVFRDRVTVTGLDGRDRLRAVQTDAGDIPADVLVIACGVDTARVASMAGLRVPLKESPGVLVHTAPLPPQLNRVVLAPRAHMKQKPDGRIVAGEGFGGTPTTDSGIEAAKMFMRNAASELPALLRAPIERVTLGYRPLPSDGFPIVGFAQGRRDIYIAVMHSGVTLSPFVGRAAAMEILDGVDVDLLGPYRLERFAAEKSRQV
jgi:glycine/D-amino acid oxidase-like deaminating enzyme